MVGALQHDGLGSGGMGVEPAVRLSARVVDEAALHHDLPASPSDLDGAVHVDAVAARRLADLVAAPEHVETRRAHASPPRDVAVPHTHARTLLDGHHVPRAGAADREVVEQHVRRALHLEAEFLFGAVVEHHAGLGRIAHPAVRLAAVAHLHGEGRPFVEPHMCGTRFARACARPPPRAPRMRCPPPGAGSSRGSRPSRRSAGTRGASATTPRRVCAIRARGRARPSPPRSTRRTRRTWAARATRPPPRGR